VERENDTTFNKYRFSYVPIPDALGAITFANDTGAKEGKKCVREGLF
jgi:hypothetical protein